MRNRSERVNVQPSTESNPLRDILTSHAAKHVAKFVERNVVLETFDEDDLRLISITKGV